MITKIKGYIGEVLILIGTIITIYNLLGFGKCIKRLCNSAEDIMYFYNDTKILLITIGTALIVLGILIAKNRK